MDTCEQKLMQAKKKEVFELEENLDKELLDRREREIEKVRTNRQGRSKRHLPILVLSKRSYEKIQT